MSEVIKRGVNYETLLAMLQATILPHKYPDTYTKPMGPRTHYFTEYTGMQTGYVWNQNGMLAVVDDGLADVMWPVEDLLRGFFQGWLGLKHDTRHDSGDIYNQKPWIVIFDPSKAPELIVTPKRQEGGTGNIIEGTPLKLQDYFVHPNPSKALNIPCTADEIMYQMVNKTHYFHTSVGTGVSWEDSFTYEYWVNGSDPDGNNVARQVRKNWNPFYGSVQAEKSSDDVYKITTPWRTEDSGRGDALGYPELKEYWYITARDNVRLNPFEPVGDAPPFPTPVIKPPESGAVKLTGKFEDGTPATVTIDFLVED
jgi:hypothetical protein